MKVSAAAAVKQSCWANCERNSGQYAASILRKYCALRCHRLGIAFRIYHSSKNDAEEKTAKRLFRLLDLKGEEYDELRSIEAAPASGEEFLTGKIKPRVQEDVASFLKTNLVERPIPWRSRKSPLAE